ncbi:MAG TPA: agmatinase [Bacteroidota bacterium]|nr:agmatinase [Bacteroidota bacterium]
MQKILDAGHNYLGIGKENSSFEHAKIVVLPVPYQYIPEAGYDAKKAPQAILAASRHMEAFDEETKRDLASERGLVTMPPLAFAKKSHEAVQQSIYDTVLKLVQQDKFVATLGGDHTVTTAAIAAHAKFYSDLSVMHFGAHSHLRSHFQGDKFCNVSAMARVCEFLDPRRLVQVGIRSQSKEEAEFIRQFGVHSFFMHEIRSGTYTKVLKYWDDFVVEALTDNVYVTFDVSAFDPSVIPATASPEPGGLLWNETMQCFKKIIRKKRIIGFDVVEFSPVKGLSYADKAAAKLISKILNYAL